jgi:two-component system response regulator CpxR
MSRTLLFIDDDRDFLAAQRAYFGTRGYTVLTADTQEQAHEVLAAQVPDLVVLDLMMEHYDSGFRLGHRIRKDARFAKTPVLMLSGVASATGQRLEADARQLAIWSKLDAFLDKPISQTDLLQAVQQRLG